MLTKAFALEMAAPLSRILCLRSPTPALRPPPRRGAPWRAVSHLSLNHLSLTDPQEGLPIMFPCVYVWEGPGDPFNSL